MLVINEAAIKQKIVPAKACEAFASATPTKSQVAFYAE